MGRPPRNKHARLGRPVAHPIRLPETGAKSNLDFKRSAPSGAGPPCHPSRLQAPWGYNRKVMSPDLPNADVGEREVAAVRRRNGELQ